MKTIIKLKDGDVFEILEWSVTKTVSGHTFLGFVYFDKIGQKTYTTMLLENLYFVREIETIKTIK